MVVALSGMVLLAIFSMLAMARKQDDDQDRLEIALNQEIQRNTQENLETIPNHIQVSVALDVKAANSFKP